MPQLDNYKQVYLTLFNEVQDCIELLTKDVNQGTLIRDKLIDAHLKCEEMFITFGE